MGWKQKIYSCKVPWKRNKSRENANKWRGKYFMAKNATLFLQNLLFPKSIWLFGGQNTLALPHSTPPKKHHHWLIPVHFNDLNVQSLGNVLGTHQKPTFKWDQGEMNQYHDITENNNRRRQLARVQDCGKNQNISSCVRMRPATQKLTAYFPLPTAGLECDDRHCSFPTS